MHLDITAENPGMMRGRRGPGAEAPRKHLNDSARLLVDGHALDMLKQRRHVTVAIRQGDPELRAAQAAAVLNRSPLRVGNRGTRGHDIDAACSKQRFVSEAVVMHELAVEEPRHGLQSHVRMRANIHRRRIRERQRSETVEKTPGPNQAPPLYGKHPRHGQRTERHVAAVERLELMFGGPQRDAGLGRDI
jgi:hypothetical protein